MFPNQFGTKKDDGKNHGFYFSARHHWDRSKSLIKEVYLFQR